MIKKSKHLPLYSPPYQGGDMRGGYRHSNLFRSSSFALRIFSVLLILYIVGKDLYFSAFFQKKDRINIVVNQDQIAYYSLGLSDNVNYFISFYPDLNVAVPGGYGIYRLGALAKLSSLERKSDLFKKTYSSLTSSFTDYYFYPGPSLNKVEVLFGKNKDDFFLPKTYFIFFAKSNAHFFDRLYIFFRFLGKTRSQFKIISVLPTKKQGDRTVFSSEDFFKTYQGFFYKRTYRMEQLNAQILYTRSFETAQLLGQILEGEGIRVVDLNLSENFTKKCEIMEEKEKFSETAKSIGRYFGCMLVSAKTGAYDIIFKLGEKEREWEID